MSESIRLPQWPAGRAKISIKEAAELLEPSLPAAPISERHKAVVERRTLAPGEPQPTGSERERLAQEAALNDDFESWMRLRTLPTEENDDGLRDELTKNIRQIIDLPEQIITIACALGVHLFHPTLGIVITEPDADTFLDEEGFRKIAAALLTCITAAAGEPAPESGDGTTRRRAIPKKTLLNPHSPDETAILSALFPILV